MEFIGFDFEQSIQIVGLREIKRWIKNWKIKNVINIDYLSINIIYGIKILDKDFI